MNALPSQSRFIIGTEACERFSFYLSLIHI